MLITNAPTHLQVLSRRIATTLLCAAATSLASAQQTLTVPTQYPTITAAITAAQSGDTVNILAGCYSEAIDFAGKAITVQGVGQGTSCTSSTILDGTGFTTRVVTFASNEGQGSVLRNLRVRNGAEGGILVDGAGPRIENCTLADNTDVSGAGILVLAPSTLGVSLQMVNCKFNDNVASGPGGGAAVVGGISGNNFALFDQCEFARNEADRGGGAYAYGVVTPSFERSIFDGNSAVSTGGGAYWRGCAAPYFIDCAFERNVATDGGGVGYLIPGSSVMRHCTLAGNLATNRGGAIFGAQEPLECEADPVFRNCLVYGNDADIGGGAYFNFTNPLLTFCTFTKNTATTSVGGILAENYDPFGANPPGTCALIELRYSILWGNTGLAAGSTNPWSKELWAETCSAQVTACDIEGSATNTSSTWTATGLLDSDPLFVTGYTCKTSPVGEVFLAQAPLQSGTQSPCVNVVPGTSVIIANRSTRTDAAVDTGRMDLGFHSPSICP